MKALLNIAKKAEGGDQVFPDLCPDPLEAAKKVTEAMDLIIPAEQADLPEGRGISSHSWRKACTSAIFKAGGDYQRVVMPWGEWDSQASCEKYVEKSYMITDFSRRAFDWLLG